VAFYENYVHLCNKIGKSPSAVAIELKLGKPSVTRWKSGTKPRDATVLKVANYFHVTVDELVGDALSGEKETLDPKIEGYSELQKAAIQFVLSLPPDKLERFVKMGRAAFEEEK
jgi:transcriptional regulator with XRE-family HTH domain